MAKLIVRSKDGRVFHSGLKTESVKARCDMEGEVGRKRITLDTSLEYIYSGLLPKSAETQRVVEAAGVGSRVSHDRLVYMKMRYSSIRSYLEQVYPRNGSNAH